MNQSQSEKNFQEKKKVFELWEGNNKFFCQGKVITGYTK
jgi:hypothetical protein